MPNNDVIATTGLVPISIVMMLAFAAIHRSIRRLRFIDRKRRNA
ncbi:hypothetical protein [Croceicoccus ponticola]|nr:hypothetical protein [Croceicoccus ponticola]